MASDSSGCYPGLQGAAMRRNRGDTRASAVHQVDGHAGRADEGLRPGQSVAVRSSLWQRARGGRLFPGPTVPGRASCPSTLPFKVTFTVTVNGRRRVAFSPSKNAAPPDTSGRAARPVVINVVVGVPGRARVSALWLGISTGTVGSRPQRPYRGRSGPGSLPSGTHGGAAFVPAAVAYPGKGATWIPPVSGGRVGQPPAAALQRGAAHRPPRARLTYDEAGASRACRAARSGVIRDPARWRASARPPGATGSVTSR